jgi:hypothetical protein|tara:strand:- start:60 stop:881 length:822 start_codon:yes stop_codon:yes gene_type:complete
MAPKQRTWNYNTAPAKKRKKYAKGGKIAALSMADNEFAAELYPYLDDNPVAKIGLDAYLFEQGKMDPNDFEQKLLNIRTNPNIKKVYEALQEGRTDIPVNPAAADYNRKTDQITMNMLSGWYKTNPEITGEIPQNEFLLTQGEYGPERTKYAKSIWAGAHGKKGQIKNLIHELTHRGANYLKQTLPKTTKKAVIKAVETGRPIPEDLNWLDHHPAMELGDREIADKLGIQYQGVDYGPVKEKSAKNRKKAIKYVWKTNPRLSKRYPSTKSWNY